MWNEHDLGYWEKEEPEDPVEEFRHTMELQAESNAEAFEALRKPPASETALYQTGWLFTEEDLKEIA